MNPHSYLCKFLSEHPLDYETILLKEYHVRTKRDGDFAIFNYDVEADFFSPVVQEARGIILNTKTLDVVCWPFRKFGNYCEVYADEIDWSHARVQDKIDGSIIKLWFNPESEAWQFSTNGVIDAKKASIESAPLPLTFDALIHQAVNYPLIPFEKLDQHKTYIFELVSPFSQVVIRYPETYLYHTGTRDNLTGLEEISDIGIAKPKEYPITSLKEALLAVEELNQKEEDVTKEGFVVVDGDYRRVKVKAPEYLMAHHICTAPCPSKDTIILALLRQDETTLSLFKTQPAFLRFLKYYEYKLEELYYYADEMAKFATTLYEEYHHDRRKVAEFIKTHPLSYVGFKALDYPNTPGRTFICETFISKITKLIDDYPTSPLTLH